MRNAPLMKNNLNTIRLNSIYLLHF